jgi:hypothetical protein
MLPQPNKYARTIMRLGLIYFLAVFLLPSIARTHHQSIFQKLMTSGDKVSSIKPQAVTGHNFLDTERFVGCGEFRDQCSAGRQPPRRGRGQLSI